MYYDRVFTVSEVVKILKQAEAEGVPQTTCAFMKKDEAGNEFFCGMGVILEAMRKENPNQYLWEKDEARSIYFNLRNIYGPADKWGKSESFEQLFFPEVNRWFDAESKEPEETGITESDLCHYIVDLNDNGGMSFGEIADCLDEKRRSEMWD
ncbi:MAG: hypothetical protein ACREN0_11580 [Thermodesulfobacteriota bacterium]